MTLGMSLEQAAVIPIVTFLQNSNWEAYPAYQFQLARIG